METITTPPTETVYNWQELNDRQKEIVVAAHLPLMQLIKTTNNKKAEHLLRLFELGKPKVVIGDSYCRIHADSVDVMKVITKKYLHKI